MISVASRPKRFTSSLAFKVDPTKLFRDNEACLIKLFPFSVEISNAIKIFPSPGTSIHFNYSLGFTRRMVMERG